MSDSNPLWDITVTSYSAPNPSEENEEDYGDYPGCDLMTVAEFLETVEWGGFIPYDGSAIIRGGTKDNEYWDWETPIPDDATHIEWYNK
jgi:hypothetical protein